MTKNKIFSWLAIGIAVVMIAYIVYAFGTLLTLGPFHPYVLRPGVFGIFLALGSVLLSIFTILALITDD